MKGMGVRHVGAAAIGGTAAIALMSAMPAHAQSQWWQPGWYGDIHAGAVYLQDPHPNVVGSFDPVVKLHTNIGAAAGISAGYQGLFIPGIRAEGEITYRTNGVDRASSSGFIGSRSATGTIDSAAFMGNLLYDFMTDSRWTPYIGGGVGAARITLNDINIRALPND